jgi:hypothetical protein
MMNGIRLLILIAVITSPAFGQLSTRNPLDELKDEVVQVLAEAAVPFSDEQHQQIGLLIEAQRQASENLFGDIMDFSNGPPQGANRDRALAGIQWINEEFKKKLPAFLTDDQKVAWEKYESQSAEVVARVEGSGGGGSTSEQIQQIRITNNAFNAENGTSGRGGPGNGGARTEVIERGGVGAFHGNFSSTFQDEALNARNPFAKNKPPYYERNINGNFSGPLLRNRLTINISGNDNRSENVGTVKAELPDGPYDLGITRPNIFRNLNGRGILQLTEAHSLHFGVRYGMNSSRNQGIGNFVLPERGYESDSHDYNFDVRQVSVLSERSVYETRVTWRRDYREQRPLTSAVAITVLDAFSGGSAQNYSETKGRSIDFSNQFYFAGAKLTNRTGMEGTYRTERNYNESNFIGEFTFSDLAGYRAGTPLRYKVTRGNPLLEMSQLQIAFYTQNDLKLSDRFTLMLGLRYQDQTNMSDHNNFDPRIGMAYALGNTTVLRGGAGIFHNYVSDNEFQTIMRLDGTRQYELQVDNPGYPDPFVSGNLKTVPPASRRVAADNLVAQYYATTQVSLERSLPANLFVTVSYDYNRGIKLSRSRNLNAPLPGTGLKPFPDEGMIIQFQSSGLSSHSNVKLAMRQRFSIFNVSANYTYYTGINDDGSGGGINPGMPTDNYNAQVDWGNAGLGSRHTFNSSVNSRLPLNVYLTTNISARSGSFYTITTGRDDNQDGVTNDRPAGVPKFTEVGPHYFNVSFNFSKAFQLKRATTGSGGPQVNVFANLNNAFNMTNPGTPSGVMTSPFFGRSTSASAAREIEAGMRFQF